MNPTFAYSFDRESFLGNYRTRNEALQAGIRAGRMQPDSPGSVYVGQLVSPNPRAFGHAQPILKEMRRRVIDDHGDIAEDFLRGVNKDLVTELDSMLEQTIVQWLEKSDLLPRFRPVEAISEHSIPQTATT